MMDGEEGLYVRPAPLRRGIGFLAQEAGLVALVVAGRLNPEKVDADTVGLCDLDANADIFVARKELGAGGIEIAGASYLIDIKSHKLVFYDNE